MTQARKSLGAFTLLFGPEYDELAAHFGLDPCDPPYGQYAAIADEAQLGLAEVVHCRTSLKLRVLGMHATLRHLNGVAAISPMAGLYLFTSGGWQKPKSITGLFKNEHFDPETNTYTVELVP